MIRWIFSIANMKKKKDSNTVIFIDRVFKTVESDFLIIRKR